MSIAAIWVLGVFWLVYGILGILGIQNIPEKYKYQSWTQDYIRMNGIGMAIFGASWFILGFVLKALSLSVLQELGLVLLFSLPALGYALYADHKSKPWRKAREEELRRQKQEK